MDNFPDPVDNSLFHGFPHSENAVTPSGLGFSESETTGELYSCPQLSRWWISRPADPARNDFNPLLLLPGGVRACCCRWVATHMVAGTAVANALSLPLRRPQTSRGNNSSSGAFCFYLRATEVVFTRFFGRTMERLSRFGPPAAFTASTMSSALATRPSLPLSAVQFDGDALESLELCLDLAGVVEIARSRGPAGHA